MLWLIWYRAQNIKHYRKQTSSLKWGFEIAGYQVNTALLYQQRSVYDEPMDKIQILPTHWHSIKHLKNGTPVIFFFLKYPSNFNEYPRLVQSGHEPQNILKTKKRRKKEKSQRNRKKRCNQPRLLRDSYTGLKNMLTSTRIGTEGRENQKGVPQSESSSKQKFIAEVNFKWKLYF